MIQKFDLHTHSRNSDGDYTVEQLVNEIRKNNIEVFSITDHDNFNSAKDIKNVNLDGLRYITGIEYSCLHDGKYEMHILGYGFDPENEAMLKSVEWLKTNRTLRMKDLIAQVEERVNLKFTEEDIQSVLNENNPGRPHLAKLLIKYGVVNCSTEAFVSLLRGLKSPHPYRLDTKEAFKLIHDAGGKVLWAHPVKVERKYRMDITEIIDSLIDTGLDGIEIGNCLHSYSDILRYEKLANEKNLLTSAGSDYHGPLTKPDVYLGDVYTSEEQEIIDPKRLTVLKAVK